MESFKRLSLDELCFSICENKRTLIIFHVRSDADAVGSAFALRDIFRVLGIPAYCACADELPERLQFLTDGVQGSVLLEEDMRLDCERIISVDSANPVQLGALFNRLHKDIDLMIDHHSSGTPYADNYIDPNASSTGEIIYRVAKRLIELGALDSIPPRVISCVFAAVSSDTGGFRFSNANPDTYRLAAELIELGADHTEISRQLFDCKSYTQIHVEGEGSRQLKTIADGRVAWISFPYSLQQELGAQSEHLGTLIDIARSLEGVEIALAIRENADCATYRVSMRSATDFDVSYVCARFGGGGHKSASGCTVTASNIQEAEQKVLAEIVKRLDK
ncbi:MAG: bifunctional oligoribonuclease/PAP phosphatase NrnA [Clostridia bacterium]|nr:bifunctional oligoribonuclease/PAP phosphatase NrnA [Clostridia bacterium]